MKLPTVLDQRDRRLIGSAVVLTVAAMLAVLLLAMTVGLALRVFMLASGLGG
jgi:hypothetical protein